MLTTHHLCMRIIAFHQRHCARISLQCAEKAIKGFFSLSFSHCSDMICSLLAPQQAGIAFKLYWPSLRDTKHHLSVPPQILFKINYTHTSSSQWAGCRVPLYNRFTLTWAAPPSLHTCGSFLSSATDSEPAWIFVPLIAGFVFSPVCHLHVYLNFTHLPTCPEADASVNQPVWLFFPLGNESFSAAHR